MTVRVFVHFIPASGTMQELIATEYMLNEWMFWEPGFRPSCAASWSCDPELTTCEDSVSSYVRWRVRTRSGWLCVTLLLLPPATPWQRLPVITLLCSMIPGGAWGPSEFSVPGFHSSSWILECKFICYLRSTFSLRSLTMVPCFGVISFLIPQAHLSVGSILWSSLVSRCSLKQHSNSSIHHCLSLQ